MTNTIQAQTGTPGSASTAASTLTEKAGEVRSVASDEVRGVAQDAKYHARQIAQESRESLRSEASNQAARVAATLRDISGQLQSMAEGQTSGGVAVDMSRQLAGTATRVADKLDNGGLDAALADVKRFARRRPGLFLIGAVGVGFATGRLLKAADTHSLMEASNSNDDGRSIDNPLALPQTSTGLTQTMPSTVVTESMR